MAVLICNFTTKCPYNITANSAISGGLYIPSGATVVNKGIEYSSDILPDGTLSTNSLTIDIVTTDIDDFVLEMIGLTPNTKYYVRGYYNDGTNYYFGTQYSFITGTPNKYPINNFTTFVYNLQPYEKYTIPDGFELIGVSDITNLIGCTNLQTDGCV